MLLWAAVAMAVTVTVSWDANTESDLAGYNIYIGESSGNYTGVVDVGNVTEFTWNNLQDGKTYFFAVTAYDFSGNESDFSAEVSVTLSGNGDTNPPELIDVVVRGETQLDVVFSEVVDQTSAQSALNYTISNGVQVLGAVLDANATVVHLITTAHERGVTYVLSVSNVKDLDGNEISAGSSKSYQLSGGNDDTTPPQVNSVAVVDLTHLDVVFNERLDATSAQRRSNYEISNGVQVLQATLSSNGQVVQLTTTSHQNETSYTLTVNDVQDEAGNTIASNSSVTYQTPAAGDNQPPTLVSVSVNGTTQIDVNFSEPVEQSTAENKSNYAINNGISVLGAILDANLTTVHLITTAHQQGDTYSLTVNNVRDRAQDPNIIAANSRISYTMIEDPISDPQDIFNPQTFALFQNYPNPFNPETEIRFFLDKQRTVELKVYNPLGQLIKSLVKEDLAAGFHTVVWDGTNEDKMQAPSGVYIYSLEVKREQAKGDMLVNVSLERRVKKMTLIR
ncbi:MAG: Ig-like domain-containing protein [bacterium]